MLPGLPRGWPLVQAIVDYVHERISFGYQHARPTKTAWDAHEERLGVSVRQDLVRLCEPAGANERARMSAALAHAVPLDGGVRILEELAVLARGR